MSDQEYKPNSIDAVLSRIETKLNKVLENDQSQDESIQRLWRALNRLDVRVAGIAGGICVVGEVVHWVLTK